VNENIFARLALDESESLAGIEPLYCSLFFHVFLFLTAKLFVLLEAASSRKQKKAASVNLQPLERI
jgi:hypothetical protein